MAPRQTYSSEVEGGTPVRLRYRIAGRLRPETYLAFVADRARWLDIHGWIALVGSGQVEMVVAGPEALVGALEMACTLGPLDALVDSIEAEEEAALVGHGFEVRL